MEETVRSSFKRELDALATIRDELKLKAHLARKDVQDEIDQLEAKYRRVDEELGRTKSHAKAEVARIGDDLKALLVDLKQGYAAVRRRLD
jgi:DNA-binding transcriptional regulator GbsR (MarR family)